MTQTLTIHQCLVLRIVITASLVALWVASPGAQGSGQTSVPQRLALVVGNADYGPADRLPNAANDALDMAAMLEELGFDLIRSPAGTRAWLNLNRDDFRKAVSELSARKDATDSILFYYSGHALQLNGRNFMIPISPALKTVEDIPRNTIDLIEIFDVFRTSVATTRIAILDACRDTPAPTLFPRGGVAAIDWAPGLAPPTSAPPGTLVSYAADPGRTARDGPDQQRNSPFTTYLLRYFRVPGLPINEVFNRARAGVIAATKGAQTPWENLSLTRSEPYFFRPPSFITAQFLAADDDATVLVDDEERLTWSHSGSSAKRIFLQPGKNHVAVKVYNQHTFTGGLEPFGGHRPEGWHYELLLTDMNGRELRRIAAREDVPAKDGPHHGGVFTVVTFDLNVDEATGRVEVTNVDDALWRR